MNNKKQQSIVDRMRQAKFDYNNNDRSIRQWIVSLDCATVLNQYSEFDPVLLVDPMHPKRIGYLWGAEILLNTEWHGMTFEVGSTAPMVYGYLGFN